VFEPRHGKRDDRDIELDRAVRCEWRRNHDRRDAAGISGSDHDDVRPGFCRRDCYIRAVERIVEHSDAYDLAAGRARDSHGLDRTEQSGAQPGAVSGNGQHSAVNVFRCLLM
jgi:hypothetical protein